MTLSWFETHAHLSDAQFDIDRDAVIKNAFDKSIDNIVEIADGPIEWKKAQSLCERYADKMFWAAGIHPYYAQEGSPENFQMLKSLSTHKGFRAIGEVGLDYFKCQIPRDIQENTFRKSIELSLEVNMPLIVHCREAYHDLIPILKSYFSPSSTNTSDSPGVVHCFSGNSQNADDVLDMGFFVGLDGPITYPKAKNLRNVFKQIPLNRIVLETDAPYLPPQGWRGKRNDPSFIPVIGEKLAEIRSTSVEEISFLTKKNAQSLFRINPS